MEILDVETIRFATERIATNLDEKYHSHPGEGTTESTVTLTRIVTDDGPDGVFRGGNEENNERMAQYLRGRDPLAREAIWRELKTIRGTMPFWRLDCALWDLAGRYADLPVYRLLGGNRKRVPAYGSTMVGDDDPEGLGTPEAYADFAEQLVEQGYGAIKLHTWMPPYDPDPDRAIAACRAVRDRVGPDIELMLDPHHFYTRLEARTIGNALSELDFLWMEEPMNEHSMSAYEWLTDEVDVPILGPESLPGDMQTRAEWIKRDVMDICRTSVTHGGITGALKCVHLCESFEMTCELHGSSIANLHLLGAMSIPGRYFERGLLHPHHGYDWLPPHLNSRIDPLNEDGTVTLPEKPGLGVDYDWEYIESNRIDSDQ